MSIIKSTIDLIKKIKADISEEKIQSLMDSYDNDLQAVFLNLKAAIATDWKWDPEDVLRKIKDVIPGFNYELLTANFDEDEEIWEIEVKINSQSITFNDSMEELDAFIDEINPFISELVDAQFEYIFTGGDLHFYLLVPNHIILSMVEKELFEG